MLGRDAEATASYRKALELKPGLYAAQLNLGILLLGQRQAAEAARLLEEAAKQKPKEFRPVFYAGQAFLDSGDPARALPYFVSAAELDPKSADAEIGIARALLQQGKLDEAAPHFAKAGELDPAPSEVELELGLAYEKAGNSDRAVAIFSKFPENPGARERLGELLLEAGKAEEAIPHLEYAVSKSGTTANRYALAMAYNATKQYAKAEPLLAQAVASETSNTDLRMTYGRVLREQKKYAPAAQEFFRATQAKPDSAEAWSDLSGMLILLEQYGPALSALEKVRELGAEKPAHFYFRAIILDKQRMLEPALENYEKFLSLSQGANPDEEFKSRQRVRIIKKELGKR
jgi:tetratricopeptide (TPR) repeat protein